MGILQEAAAAFKAHSSEARAAFGVYREYCGGKAPPRVPGMDTYDRLALRIAHGRTIEESAAREYLYRWNLAVKAFDQCERSAVSIFGTPHTLGM